MRTPKSARWAKLVGITGGGQVAVQAVTFVCGLAVIRLISVEQYAFYTLATTMLGAMGVIADGGVSSGVMVEAGKVWRDRERLAGVISTGIYLRRRLAMASMAVGFPLLAMLLLWNGASWGVSAVICVALVPVLVATLSTPILDAPLRLHRQVWPLQSINVSAGFLRLGGLLCALSVWPAAAAALLVNGSSSIFANWRLRRASVPYIERGIPVDPEAKKQIVALVRRIMPNTIYYSFSSQLTIWLVSVFGSVVAVAQVGALSRIGLALAVAKTLVMTLLFPRFTQLAPTSPLIARRFLQLQGCLWLLSLAVFAAVFVLADPILWLLGPEYRSLKKELFLMVGSSLAGLAAFTSEKLSQSRGWVISPKYFIPAAILLQIALAALLRPSSAAAAFTYGIFIQLGTYAAYTAFFLLRVDSLRRLKT
jgi:O-antigen/teichoic acid export membrane protein